MSPTRLYIISTTHRFASNPNCNNNYNNFPQSHSLAGQHKRVLVRREQKLLLCFALFEYKIVRLYIHVYGIFIFIFFFVFLEHCDQQSVNNRLFLSKRQKRRKPPGVGENNNNKRETFWFVDPQNIIRVTFF